MAGSKLFQFVSLTKIPPNIIHAVVL
jgi:hypothetical protein